jgi:hypothetical protein
VPLQASLGGLTMPGSTEMLPAGIAEDALASVYQSRELP